MHQLRQARPAPGGVRESLLDDSNQQHPRQSHRLLLRPRRGCCRARVCLLGAGPRRPGAPFRRALPHAPPGGGQHPGGHEAGSRQHRRRAAARCARGHPGATRGVAGAVRSGGAGHRLGGDQAQPAAHLQFPGTPGREHPQDVPRHGRRHPRDPDQARRPAAQHAHPAIPLPGKAQGHRSGDDGHLRRDRRPPRHLLDQERAGGKLLQVPEPGRVHAPRAAGRQVQIRARGRTSAACGRPSTRNWPRRT